MSVYKRNKVWYMDFYYNGERTRIRSNAINKRLAEIELGDIKRKIEEGRLEIEKNKNTSFADFSGKFLNSYSKIKKLSWWRDEISLRHLGLFFNRKYLNQITSADINNYRGKRREEGALDSTINREVGCLRTLFNVAIEWNEINKNPVKKNCFIRENNTRVHYLEKNEEDNLIDSCNGLIKSIVVFALNSGFRQSEILNLKWSDIDFNKGIITVTKTKNNDKKFLEMNSVLIDLLEYLRKNTSKNILYVFHDGSGDKITKNNKIFRKDYKNAVKKCGVLVRHPDFCFHSLRHSFCSSLSMKGVGIDKIAALAGHRSLVSTRRYSHYSPDSKRSAVELIATKNIVTNKSQNSNISKPSEKQNSEISSIIGGNS